MTSRTFTQPAPFLPSWKQQYTATTENVLEELYQHNTCGRAPLCWPGVSRRRAITYTAVRKQSLGPYGYRMIYRPIGISGEGVSRQYHDGYPTGDTFHVSLLEQVSLKT